MSHKCEYKCKGCEHRTEKRENIIDLDSNKETHGHKIHEDRSAYCLIKHRSCVEMEKESGDTPCGDNVNHSY